MKGKGKERAVATSSSGDELLDGDSELEFHESSSEDADSDFHASEDEASESDVPLVLNRSTRRRAVSSLDDMNEDDDEEMTSDEAPLALDAAMDDAEEQADVEAAIMASIITATQHLDTGSGSGSGANSTRLTAASLRALAAEKRQRQGHIIDDMPADSDLTSLSDDDNAAPSKSKNKKKAATKGKIASTSKPKKMTVCAYTFLWYVEY